jgi:outer membrane protein, adhesin transport system
MKKNRILLFFMFFQLPFSYADTLDDLIKSSLSSYPSILSKQSNQQAAKSDLTASKLKFLPNLSVNTQRNQVAYNANDYANLPSTTITISQPLLLDGGIIAGYQKAKAKLSIADFSLLETREDISRRIINAYVEWYKAYLKMNALQDSLVLHEKFVGMIGRRVDQGVASSADKDLAISRLLQVRADLETQRSQEVTALNSLSELVGQPLRREDLSKNPAKSLDLPPRSEGIYQAQQQSPIVQRYQYEAEAAEQEAKEIRAQALPQLSFQAQRQIGNAAIPGAPGYDLYGIVVNVATGGGFSSIASTAAAFERARSATFLIETSKRELNDRMNAEYNEFDFATLKIDSLKQSVTLAGDISSSYDRQYLVGRKSWIDLMNSLREQTQTRVQLADTEGSLLGASRRLMIYIEGTKHFDMFEESTR